MHSRSCSQSGRSGARGAQRPSRRRHSTCRPASRGRSLHGSRLPRRTTRDDDLSCVITESPFIFRSDGRRMLAAKGRGRPRRRHRQQSCSCDVHGSLVPAFDALDRSRLTSGRSSVCRAFDYLRSSARLLVRLPSRHLFIRSFFRCRCHPLLFFTGPSRGAIVPGRMKSRMLSNRRAQKASEYRADLAPSRARNCSIFASFCPIA